jgi:hypothetical protein
MEFTYHAEKLPKLDKFNKVKINYLTSNSLAHNCKNDSHIINQNLIFSNNLIPLITSYFNCNPNIYGLVNYHYLDNILELNLPLSLDNTSNLYHLNHHLSSNNYLSNNHHLFENRNSGEKNNSKLNYYKKELVQQNILSNKMIYCYQQENKNEIQILKQYHHIEKQIIIEWKLLPYLSLFISQKVQEKKTDNGFTFNENSTVNYCQIYFVINKIENSKLIDTHTGEINKLMKQFDKIISNFI